MAGTQSRGPTLEDMAALRGERYLIVSSDSHAGPADAMITHVNAGHGFDRAALWPVAQQIGPTPAEVATPLSPEELPLGRSGAFREYGTGA
jgi:hypothetical protein